MWVVLVEDCAESARIRLDMFLQLELCCPDLCLLSFCCHFLCACYLYSLP